MAPVDLERARRCPGSGRASRAGSSGGCASRPGSAPRAVVGVVARSRSPRRGRIVRVRRERERRAARPAADHLRREPEPRLGRVASRPVAARRVRLASDEVAARSRRRPGRSCAEDEVAAVAVERAAGRRSGRTRSGSRAGTRRRGRSARAGRSCASPSTNGCEIPSRNPNGSKPSRSEVSSRRTTRAASRARVCRLERVPGRRRRARRGAAARRRGELRPAPVPVRRRVLADVAEDPRAVRGRHPGDELVREHRQRRGGQAEPLEPGARERDVDRALAGRRVRRGRHRPARRASGAPRPRPRSCSSRNAADLRSP